MSAKKETATKKIIPIKQISNKILVIRGKKVMLDKDLAELYGVKTKALIQSVKRNISRFPDDFMFKLTQDEFDNLRSQIVTSSWSGRRYLPYAFTEQGVAMLSSVLNSKRAIQVNIQIIIMRAFIKLWSVAIGYAKLRRKLEELEKKYDAQFKIVFDALRELMIPPEKPMKRIGFY